MTDNSKQSTRIPWNKGRLIGPKPPLLPKHVWSIRTRLQLTGKSRDLALFNLAIDSKLRGCDVVALKAEDVAPAGYATDKAIVRQRKTGRSVKFELTDQTRQSIDDYLKSRWKRPGEFLFPQQTTPRQKPLNAAVCAFAVAVGCEHWA
jgi:integrase